MFDSMQPSSLRGVRCIMPDVKPPAWRQEVLHA